MKPASPPLLLALSLLVSIPASAEIPANLLDENLVAWCIVPFDAKKRGPGERAAMLRDLGLRRSAYDWRQEHVASFEEEILEYKEHGIEFFAFWSAHEEAFRLFEKHGLRPQVWQTLREGEGNSPEEKVAAAARSLEGLAARVAAFGGQLGLYNHGGWGGEPENLVAVCRAFHEKGHGHVGIVYNFHHGHGDMEDWAESFALMQPYLLCLNLNGMVAGGDQDGRKILPLGHGDEELAMLRVVVESGYQGAVGIIDHRNETDTAETLAENLAGLAWLRRELAEPGSGGPRPGSRTPDAAAAPPAGAASRGPAFGLSRHAVVSLDQLNFEVAREGDSASIGSAIPEEAAAPLPHFLGNAGNAGNAGNVVMTVE